MLFTTECHLSAQLVMCLVTIFPIRTQKENWNLSNIRERKESSHCLSVQRKKIGETCFSSKNDTILCSSHISKPEISLLRCYQTTFRAEFTVIQGCKTIYQKRSFGFNRLIFFSPYISDTNSLQGRIPNFISNSYILQEESSFLTISSLLRKQIMS